MSKPKTAHKQSAGRGKPAKANKNNQLLLIAVGVIVLVALAAIPFLQRQATPASAGMPAEVNVQQARELVQNGAFLLDVRTQEEWNDVHASEATLIPLDQLPQRLSEVPKDEQVVVICRSGNRSAEARDILLNAGFSNVTSVAGGMNDWRAAGFPTVSGP